MKTLLLKALTVVLLLLIPLFNYAQAPTLGTVADFVLFSSVGAVGNTGISHVTGNVGTNSGAITGFGNVNGVMHPVDGASAQCAADLLIAYNQLGSAVATLFPAPLLGNGLVLYPGIYSIAGNSTLNLDLTLDAQGDANAVFIIKIQGTFSTNAQSKVKLANGALACNVFWRVDGAVSMATGTKMRGSILSGGAITMNTGDTLEGRALSVLGAILVDGVLAYTPIGCGSPFLTGPPAPFLGTAVCYTLFSSNGALSNTPITTVIGDVGNNGIGLISGWSPADVTGTLHLVQDPSTIQCATDITNIYSALNAMIPDIQLLYPAQFGNSLVLTPHTYLLDGATSFTDTLILDAQGNANGVFVIKIINGALTTSTYSVVKLINGAQSKNVFWLVKGAVNINNYSIFRGTLVIPVGAVTLVNTGIILDGRILTMSGAITTTGVAAAMTPGCGATSPPIVIIQPISQTVCAGDSVSFTVSSSGTGLTYQWRRGNTILTDGGNISGANTDTLTINPAGISDIASNYNVIISGSVLPNDTSNYVSLVVNTAPIITIEPINKTVCTGNPVFFSVVATGTGLSYQWKKGNTNIVNSANITGANSDTLKIASAGLVDVASNYNVIVTGTCTPNDTSIIVSLILNTAPIITLEPTNKAVCTGNPVFFSVVATGTGLSYQWKKGNTNITNNANITGANSDTLKIASAGLADVASNYNVIITGTCTPNDTSINVSLILNTAPIITIEPTNKAVCAGNPVFFSVVATGTGLSYQWKKGNTNIVNSANITGANSDTLKIASAGLVDVASNYNVIVTGTCTPNDTSIIVSLILNTAPIITLEPTNKAVCTGNPVFFSVFATGTGLLYQWRKGNTNIVNSANITGANSDTLKIASAGIADVASNYNVIITGTCTPNDTSINVSLTLNTAPIITLEPTNKTVCAGNPVFFSVVASGTGLSYQWRKGNTNIVNSANITGANSDTLKIASAGLADVASNYNVIVIGDCALNDTSIFVSLTLTSLPIASASSNSPVCTGNSIDLIAQTVVGATYSWTGVNGYLSSIQSPTILASTSVDAGDYTLTINANGCNSLPSTVTVIIHDCIADLNVVKTVNNVHPLFGQNVVFTITATNNGPYDATGVSVTDILQNGYDYISSTTTTGTYNSTTGIWTIGNLNNGATAILTITAKVISTGNYVNTATIVGHEIDVNPIGNISWIEIFPTDFNIPEGFSPNGDGINDLFVIRGISNYSNNSINIYNRWGDKVFEASPYLNTWDGKSSQGITIGGDQLPIGTYFYILDLGDNSAVIKGTIYLNR